MIYTKRILFILFVLGALCCSFAMSQEPTLAPAEYTKDLMESVLYEDVTSLRDKAQSLIAQNDELEAEQQSLLEQIESLTEDIQRTQAAGKQPIKIQRTPIKKVKQKKVKAAPKVETKQSDAVKSDIEQLEQQLLELKVDHQAMEQEVIQLQVEENFLTGRMEELKKTSSDRSGKDQAEKGTGYVVTEGGPQGVPPAIVYTKKDIQSVKQENERLLQEQRNILVLTEKNQKKIQAAQKGQNKNFQLEQDIVSRRQSQKAAIEADNQRLQEEITKISNSIESMKASLQERQKKDHLLGVGELDPLTAEGKELRQKASEMKNAIDALNRETAMIQDLLEIKRKSQKDFMTK